MPAAECFCVDEVFAGHRWRTTSAWNPSRRHPVTNIVQPHNGDDIAFGGVPGAPIYAVGPGRAVHRQQISSNGTLTGAGRWVQLIQPNSDEWWFFHLRDYATPPNAVVRAGDLIGWMGSTGTATAPHLHIEFRPRGGPPINPAPHLYGAPYPMNISTKDWFDMATEADLERVVRRVVQEEIGNQDRRLLAHIGGPALTLRSLVERIYNGVAFTVSANGGNPDEVGMT